MSLPPLRPDTCLPQSPHAVHTQVGALGYDTTRCIQVLRWGREPSEATCEMKHKHRDQQNRALTVWVVHLVQSYMSPLWPEGTYQHWAVTVWVVHLVVSVAAGGITAWHAVKCLSSEACLLL